MCGNADAYFIYDKHSLKFQPRNVLIFKLDTPDNTVYNDIPSLEKFHQLEKALSD